MMYYILPTDKDIQHHGVEGQKWGQRNGPPYPLNISGKAALKKQKKNAKELIKTYKKNNKNLFNKNLSDNVNKKAKEMVSQETLNKFVEARKNWNKNYFPDFFESDDYYKSSSEAYKNTINDFKKNDPDYLDEIIKKNNGSTDDLDDFHGFRKVFEAYENDAFQKYEKEYNEKHKNELEKSNKYYDELDKTITKMFKEIVGNNLDKKISEHHNVRSILDYNINYDEIVNRNN